MTKENIQKYCTKCGKEISKNSKFCVSCGTGFKNNDSEQRNKNNDHEIRIFGKIIIWLIIIAMIVIMFLSYLVLFQDNGSLTIKDKEITKEVVVENVDSETIKQTESEKSIPDNKSYDLSSIIKQWRPLVVHVECSFAYSNTGRIYKVQSGSGFLMQFSDINNSISVITNKHVVMDRDKYRPRFCNISFADNIEILKIDFDSDYFKTVNRYDLALLAIKTPNEYIENNIFISICKEKASIGDLIVVLGYPYTGSASDITATEGIISGYDGDFYITSAKVEKGNSGGVAILLKNNCYLGTPTFSEIGETESLARILNYMSVRSR
ncbi:MAG: trypsin-like peptidase domain-containing protein [Spirochaetes bacterium]|nr:trypsin-like peptidase domain-containing protein [Spirochaetota bacterium]